MNEITFSLIGSTFEPVTTANTAALWGSGLVGGFLHQKCRIKENGDCNTKSYIKTPACNYNNTGASQP